MTHILTVTSSPSSQGSVTSALVEQFADNWKKSAKNASTVSRNLAQTAIPHLDETTIGAFYTPEEDRSDDQKAVLSLSDELISEIETAEVIVIGAPMHNFGIPSSLKAWIDHIARVGRTFVYTENGPKGLLKGKKVFVITARGGNYGEGSPVHDMDHQEPYLRTALAFIGLSDVEFIHAEGMSGGTEGREKAEADIDQTVEAHFSALAA